MPRCDLGGRERRGLNYLNRGTSYRILRYHPRGSQVIFRRIPPRVMSLRKLRGVETLHSPDRLQGQAGCPLFLEFGRRQGERQPPARAIHRLRELLTAVIRGSQLQCISE